MKKDKKGLFLNRKLRTIEGYPYDCSKGGAVAIKKIKKINETR